MKLSNNKLKNTGVLFNLINNQLTIELLSENKSNSFGLLRKYFKNTELEKEFLLYKSLQETKGLDSETSKIFIEEIRQRYNQLDKKAIQKSKFNLIKEINSLYGIDKFVKTKIEHYPILGSIYKLFESFDLSKPYDVLEIVENKKTIIEHIESDKKIEEIDETVDEFSNLTIVEKKIALKKVFETINERYDSILNDKQKDLFKDYMTSPTNSTEFIKSLNGRLFEIKQSFINEVKHIDDEATIIRLNEIIKNMKSIKYDYNDDDIVKIMEYYELENELKNIK
jgi:hypothetical protein